MKIIVSEKYVIGENKHEVFTNLMLQFTIMGE